MAFKWFRKPKETANAVAPDAVDAVPDIQAPMVRLEDPVELARRVELLINTFHHGRSPEQVANSVVAEVTDQGGTLTKEQWELIRRGAPGSYDDETLSILGKVLGVTAPYLSHQDKERDDRIEVELLFLIVMRDEKVTNFRACGPGGVQRDMSTETLREITQILKKHSTTNDSTGRAD